MTSSTPAVGLNELLGPSYNGRSMGKLTCYRNRLFVLTGFAGKKIRNVLSRNAAYKYERFTRTNKNKWAITATTTLEKTNRCGWIAAFKCMAWPQNCLRLRRGTGGDNVLVNSICILTRN